MSIEPLNLKLIEDQIMDGLKDFQRATVERVSDLYKSGQNRVLVADEVGLGKTLVAKGVIAKTARHNKEAGDNLFKVVYICSNQNIANQNISKLKITSDVTIDGVSDTRLSMQHLKIFEQENNPDIIDKFIQLIPLTPATSFSMTNGCGNVGERALIYAVLKRIAIMEPFTKELEVILIDEAKSSWEWANPHYEIRVVDCEVASGGQYIKTMIKAIGAYFAQKPIDTALISLCQKVRVNNGDRIAGTHNTLYELRMMFAQISVDLLKPDLVIMDEFQRFKFLISADVTSETGILADRFLKGNNVKILLLSATPYKLYSTLEEINETQSDDHYSEFLQVMNFLTNDKERQKQFKKTWNNFSIKLREISFDDLSIIEVKKSAENAMYQSICRTERVSAVTTGDYMDDTSVKEPLDVTEEDVLSYIEAENLLHEMGKGYGVPVDYIKSAPYILSFMKHYQLKKHIEKYFQGKPDEIKKANKKHLWINDSVIKDYGELDPVNARLERLKEVAFENKAEMLLWVPPSKPYYEPQGVFETPKNFSKIMVFSAWEMVPRMIASLISYEAERKTVGKLVTQNTDRKNRGYFTPNNKRFPVARLRFNVTENEPRAMSLFCLLYPSETLASIYDPIACLNAGKLIKNIEEDIRIRLSILLANLAEFQGDGRVDPRWYYLAPLLLDNNEYAMEWLDSGSSLISDESDDEEERGQKGFRVHLTRLKEYYLEFRERKLGKMPQDLVKILTSIVIASPAVCAYRANGGNGIFASQLAKVMMNRLNMPESTAIIELCYGKESDEAHWKNVLKYFKDGNFQAVLDEYVHMLSDLNGLNNAANKHERIHELMLDALKTHSASYTVDTFKTFKNSVLGKKEKGIGLRSHYAVGFYKGEGDDKKLINRKESIRNSFNSPFRPFVLATTSIGQEGLDFHYYCRKIMHWNLPSNPIDLEQREGRINRYKCLAIRQNIANNYGDSVKFKNNVWNELFDGARESFKISHSELIPFWCLPDNQYVKIERIVPLYLISKDIGSYKRLIKILSLYRLTLGQARQEELLEYLFGKFTEGEKLKDLFINLSPFYKGKEKTKKSMALVRRMGRNIPSQIKFLDKVILPSTIPEILTTVLEELLIMHPDIINNLDSKYPSQNTLRFTYDSAAFSDYVKSEKLSNGMYVFSTLNIARTIRMTYSILGLCGYKNEDLDLVYDISAG